MEPMDLKEQWENRECVGPQAATDRRDQTAVTAHPDAPALQVAPASRVNKVRKGRMPHLTASMAPKGTEVAQAKILPLAKKAPRVPRVCIIVED